MSRIELEQFAGMDRGATQQEEVLVLGMGELGNGSMRKPLFWWLLLSDPLKGWNVSISQRCCCRINSKPPNMRYPANKVRVKKLFEVLVYDFECFGDNIKAPRLSRIFFIPKVVIPQQSI